MTHHAPASPLDMACRDMARVCPPAGGDTPIIRVVDFETTGGDPPEHKVIEVGWTDILPFAYDLAGRPVWTVDVSGPTSILVDPGRELMPESSAVHQLIASDLVGAPSWDEVLPHLLAVPPAHRIVAWAAFGIRTEQGWLTPAVLGAGAQWVCCHKLALRLWPEAPRHSNQVLRFWRDPAGFDRHRASPAHRAGPDSFVTAQLLAQLLEHVALDQAVVWSTQPALLARVPFGDHRGGRWADVDDGFLHWVLARQFDEDVMHTARTELDRRYPPQPAAGAGDDHPPPVEAAAGNETAKEDKDDQPF